MLVYYSLRWCHNGRDSVSNHQPHDCLLNRLFRRRSKKTSKLRVTGLCVGNSPGNSPHKWPVTRKMFQFDDVIMSHLYCSYYPGHLSAYPSHCIWFKYLVPVGFISLYTVIKWVADTPLKESIIDYPNALCIIFEKILDQGNICT